MLNPIDSSEQQARQAKIAPIFEALKQVYGPLVWRPDKATEPMDELISCILSQNTSDVNRDKAFFAMKAHFRTWQAVADAPTPELIDVLRPAGLANQKAPRIQAVLRRIYAERGAYDIGFLRDLPQEDARAWLMSFDGIGPKTAAIVLCFAFGLPALPVDTHVHRVSTRLGLIPPKTTADKAHPLLEALVPGHWHYPFHIYLIRHGRETCTARTAHCQRCPLTELCDHYQTLTRGTPKAPARTPKKQA
jgi:endonuclease-3